MGGKGKEKSSLGLIALSGLGAGNCLSSVRLEKPPVTNSLKESNEQKNGVAEP